MSKTTKEWLELVQKYRFEILASIGMLLCVAVAHTFGRVKGATQWMPIYTECFQEGVRDKRKILEMYDMVSDLSTQLRRAEQEQERLRQVISNLSLNRNVQQTDLQIQSLVDQIEELKSKSKSTGETLSRVEAESQLQ